MMRHFPYAILVVVALLCLQVQMTGAAPTNPSDAMCVRPDLEHHSLTVSR